MALPDRGGLPGACRRRSPCGGRGGQSHPGPIAFHLVLAAVLVVGAAFDDRLGQVLRPPARRMALLGSLVVVEGTSRPIAGDPVLGDRGLSARSMSLMIAGYGFALGHRTSLACAGLIAAFAGWPCVGWRGYCCAPSGSPRASTTSRSAWLLFSLAVLTSMAKGGVLPSRTDRPQTRCARFAGMMEYVAAWSCRWRSPRRVGRAVIDVQSFECDSAARTDTSVPSSPAGILACCFSSRPAATWESMYPLSISLTLGSSGGPLMRQMLVSSLAVAGLRAGTLGRRRTP